MFLLRTALAAGAPDRLMSPFCFPLVGSLIQCARVDDLHELMVVAIVYWHSDNHGPVHRESFLDGGRDLIGRLYPQPFGAEGLGESNDIDRTKVDARGSSIFRHFLKADHIGGAVHPNQVNKVAL